jgi:hypothetical protein
MGQPLADCDFNLAALHPAYPIKRRTSAERTQAPESVDTGSSFCLDLLENSIDVKRTSRTAAVDVAVGRIPVVRGSCAYVRVAPEVKSFRGELEPRVGLTHLLTLEGFRLNTPNLIEPTLERIRIHSREIWNAPNQ